MARLFDDANSQFLRRTAALLTSTPFTMACWFRSDDTTIGQTLMSLGHNTTASHIHALRAAGATAGDPVNATSQAGAGAASAATTTGYSANTWHHACGVWASATDRRAFIDGGSKGTDTNSRSPSLDRTLIGATLSGGTASAFMSGRIAEAAVWSIALSDAEVALLALGVSPLLVRPESLVAYWPLIGRYSPEIDLRAAFDLTLTASAPVVADHCRIVYVSSERRASVAVPFNELTGALAQTIANFTLAASGTLEIAAAATQTLEGFGPGPGTGVLDISGSLSQALANVTSDGDATLEITGALSKTLANFTLSAQGALDITGATSRTLENFTLDGDGVLGDSNEGALSQTLANATLDGDGALNIDATLAQTLQNATLVATGTLEIAGSLSRTLANATLSAQGTLTIEAQVAKALADATLAAQGALAIDGQLSQTLANATLSAQGAEDEEEEPAGPPSFIFKTSAWSRSFRTGSSSRSFRSNG